MKVLLVDNDQCGESSLTRALTENNYVVNVVTDGETALTVARNCPYDLILLNLIPVHHTGVKLCEGLRGDGYRGSIMVLTRQPANPTECDRSFSAGANECLGPADDVQMVLSRMAALLHDA